VGEGTIATTPERRASDRPAADDEAGGEAVGDTGAADVADQGSGLRRRQRWVRLARGDAAFVVGLTLLAIGLPLLVALAAVWRDRWFPAMDLALTEMRVRDVGTGDPPLVGLIGRLYGLGERGSHPGPLSFWVLWPLYKVFGSDPRALEIGTAALNVAATGLCIGIAHRRGGRPGALGVAAVLVVLARSYGADLLTQPWNPHLPVLWWMVFLLAVWSVLCDDAPMLPVAVFAGTFCVQTHISYLGLVLGVGVPALLVVAATAVRRRGGPAGDRRLLRWGGGSLALLLVLWLPPIVDQLTADPGNGSILRDAFAHPEHPPVGFGRRALELWLRHLDPFALLQRQDQVIMARDGSTLPGLLLLAVWVASALFVVRQWRRRQPGYAPLVRLQVVTAAAIVLGFVSFARILGDPFYWVVLWAWGITALVLVAVGWTLARALRDLPQVPGGAPVRLATGAAGAVLAVGSLVFVRDATSTEVYGVEYSLTLGQVAPPTVAHLREVEEESGRSERWLLRWERPGTFEADPIPYGLVLELERHGLDVGTPVEPTHAEVPYRVRDPADATAVVDYVVDQPSIDRWRRDPDAVEIAHGTYLGHPIAVFTTD
jgi:hypothetical protein